MDQTIKDLADRTMKNYEALTKQYAINDTCAVHYVYRFFEHNLLKKEPEISKVIFNPPATIIIWDDDTKTVVKCGENDIYDPEKGMAMAICKKAFGNKGNYCNIFKQWLPKEEVQDCYNRRHGDKNLFDDPRKPLKSNWEPKTEFMEKK